MGHDDISKIDMEAAVTVLILTLYRNSCIASGITREEAGLCGNDFVCLSVCLSDDNFRKPCDVRSSFFAHPVGL